ncbi:MAG: hypothetical protein ABI697_09005 [Devosia sp.]
MRVLLLIAALLAGIAPSEAGMYRLQYSGFYLALDETCATMRKAPDKIWIHCAPDGQDVTLFATLTRNKVLPAPSVDEDFKQIARTYLATMLAETEWQGLLPRLDLLGGLRKIGTLVTEGFVCPTVVDAKTFCWKDAEACMSMRVVPGEAGSLALVAIGACTVQSIPIGKSGRFGTEKALPETARAMVGSFGSLVGF